MRRSTSARALACEVSGKYGTLWKCTNTTRQPRFIMRQAATGESMPPESSAATVPLPPTGRPPGPGRRSSETKASSGSTSTTISTSGCSRSTRVATRCSTNAPSARFSSTLVSG